MAEITATFSIQEREPGCRLVTWTPITESDTVVAVELGAFADRSIQVEGTFGGTSVAFQGSNDGVNWHTLKNHIGDDIDFTLGGLSMVAELTRYIRPNLTGGAGVSLTVTVFCRGSHFKIR